MEAVSDLLGLGRALTNSLCVEPASIAADDLDLGMLREPFHCLRRRSDRQHVNDVATLQINDDRPIGDANARLGANADCYSFIAVDFHHLLFAGFYRRTGLLELCTPTYLPSLLTTFRLSTCGDDPRARLRGFRRRK